MWKRVVGWREVDLLVTVSEGPSQGAGSRDGILAPAQPSSREEAHSNEIQTNPTPLITPTKPSVRKFTYKPLNFDRNEIRLLTLLQPVDGGSTNIVMCRMEHFSLSDLIPEYVQYLDALDNEGTIPRKYHDGWFQHSSGDWR